MSGTLEIDACHVLSKIAGTAEPYDAMALVIMYSNCPTI